MATANSSHKWCDNKRTKEYITWSPMTWLIRSKTETIFSYSLTDFMEYCLASDWLRSARNFTETWIFLREKKSFVSNLKLFCFADKDFAVFIIGKKSRRLWKISIWKVPAFYSVFFIFEVHALAMIYLEPLKITKNAMKILVINFFFGYADFISVTNQCFVARKTFEEFLVGPKIH